MSWAAAAAQSVLVIEDRAHDARGHAPFIFAELARALAEHGAHVEVLTARGWCRGDGNDTGIPVHTYGPIGRRLHQAVAPVPHSDHGATQVQRTMREVANTKLIAALWNGIRRARGSVRVALLAAEARSRLRKMPGDTSVIVVSNIDMPALTSLVADDRRWLMYVYFPPPSADGLRAGFRSLTHSAVATRERVRRRGGGRFVIAAPSRGVCGAWERSLPALDAATMPLAGVTAEPVVDGARARLGLDATLRIVLLFGAAYAEKMPEIALGAVAHLPGWDLVVAGTLADGFPDGPQVHRFPGFVDDDLRAALFSSADVVVLSFTPGFDRDSGTLMNAIAWGVPVVCSDGCAPADVVRTYRLGEIFTPGVETSLARAIADAAPIDPADLARARAALSNDAVAARVLRELLLPA